MAKRNASSIPTRASINSRKRRNVFAEPPRSTSSSTPKDRPPTPPEEARRPVRLRKRLSVLRLGMVLPLQIKDDIGELAEGGLEISNNLLGENVGIGMVGAVFNSHEKLVTDWS